MPCDPVKLTYTINHHKQWLPNTVFWNTCRDLEKKKNPDNKIILNKQERESCYSTFLKKVYLRVTFPLHFVVRKVLEGKLIPGPHVLISLFSTVSQNPVYFLFPCTVTVLSPTHSIFPATYVSNTLQKWYHTAASVAICFIVSTPFQFYVISENCVILVWCSSSFILWHCKIRGFLKMYIKF